MGPGTLEAKLIPIAESEHIKDIFVLRKAEGPKINKVQYIILPHICKYKFFNLLITPFLLTYHAKKRKVNLILSYHFIPHTIFAFIASIITRIPYNFSQTGLLIEKYVQNKIVGKIFIYIIRSSLFINVPGEKSKKFWIQKGIDEKKLFVLHSKIDAEIFKPDNQTKIYDFIYLGRLSKEKRVHLIIYGIKELIGQGIKTSLAIVGNGPESCKLVELTNSLNLQEYVTFTGFTHNTASWLNKARIFLLTSETEALPTALMQAMSCKLVCVAPDIGNISDLVISDINGYLFQKDNIGSFHNLMKAALVNYDLLQPLRENARNMIKSKYVYSNATELWDKILRQELNELM